VILFGFRIFQGIVGAIVGLFVVLIILPNALRTPFGTLAVGVAVTLVLILPTLWIARKLHKTETGKTDLSPIPWISAACFLTMFVALQSKDF